MITTPMFLREAASKIIGYRHSVRHKEKPDEIIEPGEQTDSEGLNCRVQLSKEEKDDSTFDIFSVEISGSIHTTTNTHSTTVRISITDITDGAEEPKPIHSNVKQWQVNGSQVFVYNADLGKLPEKDVHLENWMSIARINVDWLKFPRKGKRHLQFNLSILAGESGDELASTKCILTYENAALGYIDEQENHQRVKTLAVALAFAVSAADKKLYNCEVEVIKNWARDNIDVSGVSRKARRKLEKALNTTVRFFRNGNQLDDYKICKELTEIAPLAERYGILELCLRVARADGVASAEELELLKNLANRLEVDTNKFREMTEKILPANIHEVQDAKVILGITAEMSRTQSVQQLNNEYRKWNARVNNPDAEVQAQADYMLTLISEARSKYIEG